MNITQSIGQFKTWFLELFTDHGSEIMIAFLIIFGALLLDFIQRQMVKRLQKQVKKTKTPWDDALLDSMAKPASLFIWILGISIGAEMLGKESGAPIFDYVVPLRTMAIIVAFTWFVIRFINHSGQNIIAERRKDGKTVDETAVEAIVKLARVSVMITSALVMMQTMGFSISGLLAFGGVGGLAVGLAAKDLISNFFGGLMLYLDRPFSVGDWVRSPDKEIEGTVEEIGWRLTRIRSFSKRPLYVPNSIFSSITVENPSRMSNRRINETIGIRYADAARMDDITREVKEMLVNHPEIDENLTLMVHFNAFAPSSLDFFIYCFTHTTVWTKFHEIKQDVLLRIEQIITSHGAEIAFPTSTVHLPDELKLEGLPPGSTGGHRVRPEPEAE